MHVWKIQYVAIQQHFYFYFKALRWRSKSVWGKVASTTVQLVLSQSVWPLCCSSSLTWIISLILQLFFPWSCLWSHFLNFAKFWPNFPFISCTKALFFSSFVLNLVIIVLMKCDFWKILLLRIISDFCVVFTKIWCFRRHLIVMAEHVCFP